MALAPLATVADLSARGVDISDIGRVTAALLAASASIRDAAGCTISEHTATITISGAREAWLPVPGWAIRSVTNVDIDDTPVTDHKLVSGRLWRAQGWQPTHEPSLVTMTVTQGLGTVDADIIDLCCSLTAAGIAAAEDEYDPKRSIAYERLDDYQYGLRQGDDEVINPMILPEGTREMLQARFAGAVAVTGTY